MKFVTAPIAPVMMFIALSSSLASADAPPLSMVSTGTSIRVQAHIDGRDHLILHGQTAQWHHFEFAAVGRHEGRNLPTLIGGTPGSPHQTIEWIPDWPLPPPNEIRFEARSSILDGLMPSVPPDGLAWQVDKILGRGDVRIVEQPTPANSFTLIVEFDDNVIGGSADYEIVLSPAFDAAARIDVKPYAARNRVDLKGLKNVRVAILGDSATDALQIDPATARLSPGEATARRSESSDYNADGFIDLGLIFRVRDLGLHCGIQQVTLTAQTYSGAIVGGTDELRLWNCWR